MDDPFHHLHVEDYAASYDNGRVGADEMIFVRNRPRMSLNGEWRFVTDLFDEGLRQQWFCDLPSDAYSFSVPRDHDWGDWQRTPVPSCWNMQKSEWRYFEGSCWYTREFLCPSLSPGEQVYLRIGAANYECRLFLNSQFIGAHRGGATPCFFHLNPYLQTQNLLHIQVENRRRPERVPMHHIDWFNYGGLYRDVELIVVPKVFIRDFRMALVRDDIETIIASVTVSGPSLSVARLQIAELGIDTNIELSAGHGSLRIAATPQLWSPQDPKLYRVEVSAGDDRIVDQVGFRTIQARGRNIFLNGNPLWLRGICCHEDDVHLGHCSNDEDIRRRFAAVRELGANAVRLAHYPHHERVAEIADQEGILLIEEIPVYWAIDFNNPDTLADATNQLRELIRRDWNRASVVFWSIGNENADTDERLAFMQALAQTVRREDPYRLIIAACLINREQFRIEDRLMHALDVIGVNEYFGWYEPDIGQLQQLLDRTAVDKPVIITETGADAVTGHMGAQGELFSEAHQAYVLDHQVRIAARTEYMAGIFPWLLYDFRTERRQTRLQQGWNLKGLIDRDKITRKRGFEQLKQLYYAIKEFDLQPTNLHGKCSKKSISSY